MKLIFSFFRWMIFISLLLTGCAQQATMPIATVSMTQTPVTDPTQPVPTVTERSPAGISQILFSSERNDDIDIYAISPDGDCLRRFAAGGTDDTSPVWSPDGSHIAYEGQLATNNRVSNIFVMDADGDNPEKLADVTVASYSNIYQIAPRWSPDGTQIGYVSLNDEGGYADIYKSVVGSGEVTLVAMDWDNQYFADKDNTSTRSWSPDGEKLVYQGLVDNYYQLILASAEGGEPTNLTDEAYDHYDPTWSPDGRQILYIWVDYESDPVKADIYVINADGSNNHAINSDAGTDYYPIWSPDGTQIVFVSERDGNPEIYLVDADGQNLVRLTDDLGIDDSPTWSPDGKQLAFVSDRDGNKEIYTLTLDGHKLQRLTDDPADDYSPAWSPAGVSLPPMVCSEQASPSAETPGLSFVPPPLSADAISLSNIDGLAELQHIDIEHPFQGSLQALAWAPDGNAFAVGTSDGVYLFDYPSLDPLWKAETSFALYSLDFSPDGKVLAGGGAQKEADNTVPLGKNSIGVVDLWQAFDGTLIRSFSDLTCRVDTVEFSPLGDTLASAACDGMISVWSLSDSALLYSTVGGTQDVTFSPDGLLLAYVTEDDHIVFLDTRTWQPTHEITNVESLYGLEFSPDGSLLAGRTSGKGIILWDVAQGTQKGNYLPDKFIEYTQFSPDNKTLAVAFNDYYSNDYFQLISSENGEVIWDYPGHPAWIYSSGFSPDGSVLISGCSEDNLVRFWSAQDGSLQNSMSAKKLRGAAFDLDAGTLISGWSDGILRSWQVDTAGEPVNELPNIMLQPGLSDPGPLVFSPDGRFIASSSLGNVWDTTSGEIVKQDISEEWEIVDMAFSPDGKSLAVLHYNGGQLWNVADWSLARILKDLYGDEFNLMYSPDGKMLTAEVSFRNEIRLYKSNTGALILVIYTDVIPDFVAFSPDSALMVTANYQDDVIQFWQVSDGSLVREITYPALEEGEGVSSLRYSPSGDFLIARYTNGFILIWNTADGSRVKSLDIAGLPFAFSPDGRYLFTVTPEGSISVWGIRP